MLQLPMSGRHDGDLRLVNDLDFCGLVTGTVTVPPGMRLRLYGKISGDLIVQTDGKASIYGSIAGAVQNHGAIRILGRAGRLLEAGNAATIINDRAAMAAPLQETAPLQEVVEVVEEPPKIAVKPDLPARPRRPAAKRSSNARKRS